MIIPSMVNRKRTLLALKLSIASLTISLNIIVERALCSVLSKELILVLGGATGLGRFAVAIDNSPEELDAFKYRSGAMILLFPGIGWGSSSVYW
jgi:hypothetical protein